MKSPSSWPFSKKKPSPEVSLFWKNLIIFLGENEPLSTICTFFLDTPSLPMWDAINVGYKWKFESQSGIQSWAALFWSAVDDKEKCCAQELQHQNCIAAHCRTLQHTAAHCRTNKEKLLQHEDPSSDQNCITKSFTELTHCNDAPCTLCNDALQHELQLSTSDATHCNEAPQHTALHADQRCVEEKCGSAKVANSDAVSIAKLQNCILLHPTKLQNSSLDAFKLGPSADALYAVKGGCSALTIDWNSAVGDAFGYHPGFSWAKQPFLECNWDSNLKIFCLQSL